MNDVHRGRAHLRLVEPEPLVTRAWWVPFIVLCAGALILGADVVALLLGVE